MTYIDLALERDYLEDMLINGMILLNLRFMRNELYGQLEEIWVKTKTMLSTPPESPERSKTIKILLLIQIEKPISKSNNKYQKVRKILWFLRNALNKLVY